MSHRLATAFIALLALACGTKQPSDTPDSDDGASPVASPEAEPEPGPEMPTTTLQLSHFDTKPTVERGTELRYSYESHPSVGLSAKYEIEDPAIVAYVRTDMKYDRPQDPPMDGGDAGTGTFVFQALAAGTTKLRVIELMRGTAKLELEYTIEVVEP